jgi:beta-aspartyl-peptidase (threonine type)
MPGLGQTSALAIHGGAGVERGDLTAEKEIAYRAALLAAMDGSLSASTRRFESRRSRSQIRVLETIRCSTPAAAQYSQPTVATNSMLDHGWSDAQGGGGGGVTRTRNPISLARAVMEKSPHVMLARRRRPVSVEQGLPQVDPAYFRTEQRWQQCSTGVATTQSCSIPRTRAARSALWPWTFTAIWPRELPPAA